MNSVAPGAWLGLLGGGQLGRMFASAAQSLGYRVLVIDPDRESPAGRVADDHIRADYLDFHALQALAQRCSAVTTEFENVPAEALKQLARDCVVSPGHDCVAVAQDRIREKRFLASAGLGTVPFAVVEVEADFRSLDFSLFPGIIKTARLGYDGKGQVSVANVDDALLAFRGFGAQPCVLERRLVLGLELSVVVARSFDGSVVTFPVAENQHTNGILDLSLVPARIPRTVAEEARLQAIRVAEALDYRGVMCVEFFRVDDGRLLVNEIAPRPHNSGHYSVDGCITSQFEQQVRVMCGQPLGDTALHCPAVMVNLLGDLWEMGEPNWGMVLKNPRAKLHLYGKEEARPGRKMGHFTVLADYIEEALEIAHCIKSGLAT